MFDSLREDLRLARRGVRRAGGFAVLAILTFAMGIAGVTVMFTLVRGVLLRPLPVHDQARLVVAWTMLPESGPGHLPFGKENLDALASGSRLFEGVGGIDANGSGRELVFDDGAATPVSAALVTGAFFETVGVRPVLGRTLLAADDVDGAEKVVVIGHSLWQRRFGGSPAVLGRRLTLEHGAFTIVGVLPPDFAVPAGAELWRTAHSVPTDGPFGDAARQEVDLVARLRPGITIDDARAELAARVRQREHGAPGRIVPVVRPFADVVVGGARGPIAALMAAVGLVLLIACANVANLQLMRATTRRTELAVHAALGAGVGRLIRRVALESILLGGVGGALGAAVALAVLQVLRAAVPGGLPRADAVRVDGLVVLCVAGVTIVAASLAALAPAGVVRRDTLEALRTGGRGTAARASRRGRRGLVVVQVALAVAVVAAAGGLGRTLASLATIDPAIAGDRLVFVELSLPSRATAAPVSHAAALEALVAGVGRVPGVAAVTPIDNAPFAHGWLVPAFTAEGQDVVRAAANPSLSLESIWPQHFATLGVPVVRGRAFTAADRKGAVAVAIVSADVAARTWPGQDPIGRRLRIGGESSWLTVVGVAADVRYRELASPMPTLYLPAAQFLTTAQRLAVRTTGPPEATAAALRGAIRAIDRDVHVLGVSPFAVLRDAPLAAPRFHAVLLAVFAAVAWLLAVVGLAAVLALSVRERAREIAIRVAVGATRWRVGRLVAVEAAALAALGGAIGAATAAGGASTLAAVLDGADALDPGALAIAAASLVAAALVAAIVPVRRAAGIDPAVTLRQ